LFFFFLKRHVFPCSFENLLVADYEYLCQQEAAKAGEDDDDLEDEEDDEKVDEDKADSDAEDGKDSDDEKHDEL